MLRTQTVENHFVAVIAAAHTQATFLGIPNHNSTEVSCTLLHVQVCELGCIQIRYVARLHFDCAHRTA